MSIPFAELKQRANTPLDPNTANVDAWTKKAESLLSGVREQMNSQHGNHQRGLTSLLM